MLPVSLEDAQRLRGTSDMFNRYVQTYATSVEVAEAFDGPEEIELPDPDPDVVQADDGKRYPAEPRPWTEDGRPGEPEPEVITEYSPAKVSTGWR